MCILLQIIEYEYFGVLKSNKVILYIVLVLLFLGDFLGIKIFCGVDEVLKICLFYQWNRINKKFFLFGFKIFFILKKNCFFWLYFYYYVNLNEKI